MVGKREQWYSGSMVKVKCFKNWMIDAASVLFDDNNNDLRALPKTVRLQLLVVLSFEQVSPLPTILTDFFSGSTLLELF